MIWDVKARLLIMLQNDRALYRSALRRIETAGERVAERTRLSCRMMAGQVGTSAVAHGAAKEARRRLLQLTDQHALVGP